MAADCTTPGVRSRLFQKLHQLIGDLNVLASNGYSHVANLAPLYLDVFESSPNRKVIFLAQYYISTSGDWVPSPEFKVAIDSTCSEAEAWACSEPDISRSIEGVGDLKSIQHIRLALNTDLECWLDLWIAQGHTLEVRGGRGE